MGLIDLIIVAAYFSITILVFVILSKFCFFSCDRDKEIQAFILYSILWVVCVPVTIVILVSSFMWKCSVFVFEKIYDKAIGSDKFEK